MPRQTPNIGGLGEIDQHGDPVWESSTFNPLDISENDLDVDIKSVYRVTPGSRGQTVQKSSPDGKNLFERVQIILSYLVYLAVLSTLDYPLEVSPQALVIDLGLFSEGSHEKTVKKTPSR